MAGSLFGALLGLVLSLGLVVPASAQVPCLNDRECGGDEVCQLPTGGAANKTGSCVLASDIIFCNMDAHCDAGGRCFQLDDNALLKLPVGTPAGICIAGRAATTTTTMTTTAAVSCSDDGDCDSDQLCQLPTGPASSTGVCVLAADLIFCYADANCTTGSRCAKSDDNALLKPPADMPPGICISTLPTTPTTTTAGRVGTTSIAMTTTTTAATAAATTTTMPPKPTTTTTATTTPLITTTTLRCDTGYALNGTKCIPACMCGNGTAATGASCPSPGAAICASCNTGYALNGTKCIPACTCGNGTAATGASCPSAGAAICTSCNAPYVLNGTSCTPVPCLNDWDCDSDQLCQLPTEGPANNPGLCVLGADLVFCYADANCTTGGRCVRSDDNALLKPPADMPPGICIAPPTTPTTTTAGRAVTTTTARTTTIRTTTTVTSTTKSTTTQDSSYCTLPASDASLDISSCLRKTAPASCNVRCAEGYTGLGSQYKCSVAATGFVGLPPTCTPRPTTLTTTTLPRCTRIPWGVGIDTSDCANKVAGTNCTLACTGAYAGASTTLTCDDSGNFQGDKPTCSKPQCTTGLPGDGYDVSACSGKEVGQACQVTCLPGYISKKSMFTCQSTGAFKGDLPTCTRLTCSKLPIGVGVNSADCQGKQSGDSCTVTCRDGYIGTSVALTCGNDGAFAAAGGGAVAPTCTAKACTVPDALTTAATLTHNCGSMNMGSRCVVSCADGYSGANKEWTCGASGLTGTLPTCTGKKCTRRSPSGDGVDSTACAGTTTGQSCTATCVPGYDATGSGTVTCQANGAFTDATLACTRKTCAALTTISGFRNPPVENSCGGKIYKQTCSAKCTDGYWSAGGAVSSLKCGADGTFTSDKDGPPFVLTCVANQCSVGAPRLWGVSSDCSGKTTGQTCTASAVRGFTYVGGTSAKTLTCQGNGAFAWVSGAVQVQPGTCDAKPTWTEGVANNCDGLTYGQTCYVYCQSGYQKGQRLMVQYKCDFIGNVLTIQPDPDMRETPLTCVKGRRLQGSGAACTTVPDLSDSMQTDCSATQASGTSCIVQCADGYNISGSPTLLNCDSGVYSPTSRPTCNPIPCTFNAPDGVGVTSDCNGTGTGSTCTAQCGPGYAGANVTFTCTSTGQFNGTSPTCSALACTAPSLGSQYATSDCANKTTGQTCLVGCSDGYTLTGSPATYTCGTSQAFTGTVPTCTAAMCTSGVPTGGDLNVSVACSTLTTGQTCSVACANGYSGAATTLTCGSSGSLTGMAPTCTLQTCADLSPGASFSHTCTNKTMGTSCTVDCANGYQLATGQSAQTFQCAWDASAGRATLQGSLPTCTGVPCVDNIPTGDTISQNCGSVPTGSTCSASCLPGHTGTPATATLTCLASGALSGTAPTCAKMTCPAYESDTSYDASLCSAVVFGDSCLVSCEPGYNGTAASLACQLDSDNMSVVLTGNPPTCTAMQCIYNLPQGTQFQHDCSGRVTGENCTVSCAAGWGGTPASLSCGADQTLAGTMPTCVVVTTTGTDTSTTVTETSTTITMTTTKTTTRTMTSSTSTSFTSTVTSTTRTGTTTMTTTRTRTVTTRVNATEKVTTVLGSMKLQVADPASFVSDPDAKAAVEQGIAGIAGVPAAYVNATLSVVDTGRRLAAGNTSVAVDYTIGIPDSLMSDLPPIDSILANLTMANTTSMKAAISAALDAITPGKYAVDVVYLTPPQESDDGSVMVKTSSPDKKKTGIIVGCVIGVIGGCGCIWGLGYVLYKCFGGHDESAGLVGESSPSAAAV